LRAVSLIYLEHTTTASHLGTVDTTMTVWTFRCAFQRSAACSVQAGSSIAAVSHILGISRASIDVISSSSHGNLDFQSNGCAAKPCRWSWWWWTGAQQLKGVQPHSPCAASRTIVIC